MTPPAPLGSKHLAERAVEALGITAAALPKAPDRASALPQTTIPLAERAMAAARALPQPVAKPTDGHAPAVPPRKPISMDQMEKAGLRISGTRRSRLSEEISVAQYAVLRGAKTDAWLKGNAIVLITSARPDEGKSFCSLNLSAGMAIHGSKPIILVDTDGKKQSMSELLGCHDEPGLRAMATDPQRPPQSLLVPTTIANLQFLPFGAVSPGEMTQTPGSRMSAAIQALAASMPDHVIVVDTPPCLSTSDPSTLAAIAGQVVMVVCAEKTQRSEVEAALDMVDSCERIQLLLNRVELTASDTFGAYGGYGAYDTPKRS